jgi:hypothetical protein
MACLLSIVLRILVGSWFRSNKDIGQGIMECGKLAHFRCQGATALGDDLLAGKLSEELPQL